LSTPLAYISLAALLHTAILLVALHWIPGSTVLERLSYLDAAWYEHIARHGYAPMASLTQPPGAVFAFFPLWPLLLHGAALLFPSLSLATVGVGLSALALVAGVALAWRLGGLPSTRP
jgi:hypothetical protein